MNLSFEQEIKHYLADNRIPFHDGSASFKDLDFMLPDFADARPFRFDAKEKRQKYNMNNWKTTIPEQHLFIMDDLAARKILAYAPRSAMIVRNNILQNYVLFTILDLFLIPKQRANRVISKKVETLKGKWLIDLRNGPQFESLNAVFAAIRDYLEAFQEIFLEKLECHGSFQGEDIDVQGITRRPEHWQVDVAETR